MSDGEERKKEKDNAEAQSAQSQRREEEVDSSLRWE
jgi:hypothetical protein